MKIKLLYRVLIAICGVAVLSGALLAQQPVTARPADDAVLAPNPLGGKCTVTSVYVKGALDNFASPADPASPSPALAAYLGPSKAGYDVDAPNRHFGDSFRLCACETCGAKLEIRVRKVTGIDIPQNDGYAIGVAPFTPAQTVAKGTIWTNNNPEPPKTLTINLNPATLAQVLCHQSPSGSPWLDVYVQDDTEVDWMRLTITHP